MYATASRKSEIARRLRFERPDGQTLNGQGLVGNGVPDHSPTPTAQRGPTRPQQPAVAGPAPSQLGLSLTAPAPAAAPPSAPAATSIPAAGNVRVPAGVPDRVFQAAQARRTRDGGGGPGMSPENIQRQGAKMGLRDAKFARPYLRDLIRDLFSESQGSGLSEADAAALAADLERISGFEDRAGQALQRDGYARGLTDSSYAAAREGQLAGAGMDARAGAVRNAHQSADQRRELARQMAAQLLMQFRSGSGNAAQIAAQIQQLRMQQQQMDAQNDGSFMGDLFGTVGSLAGAAAGLGWRPF